MIVNVQQRSFHKTYEYVIKKLKDNGSQKKYQNLETNAK